MDDMLNLALSLALLGAATDAPPIPGPVCEHVRMEAPEVAALPQGYEDWWIALFFGKKHRHRNYPTEAQQQPPPGPPPGNLPTPGPLPLVLLGMGVLGVGAAAASRRRKRQRRAAVRRSLDDK